MQVRAVGVGLFLFVLFIFPSFAFAATEPDFFRGTIPNFCKNPTIQAVRNGNWNDATLWEGNRLPGDADIVMIPSSMIVTFNSTATVSCVGIHGELTFQPDSATQLKVTDLLVYNDGHLKVGTESTPITSSAKILIRDVPLKAGTAEAPGIDPQQYGNGLLAIGKVTMHGESKPSFVRLAVAPLAGATTLTVESPVTGWRVGDEIALADSEQRTFTEHQNFVDKYERRTITSITPDARTITLNAPLLYAHPGAKDENGVPVALPHIANLTRSVVIRSENPTGIRGHTFFTSRAQMDIRSVQFDRLGRTTVNALDDTTFDAGGRVTSIGTNQSERHPVSLSSLIGPANPPPDTMQFTFKENVISGDSTLAQFSRSKLIGLSVIEGHFGLIQGNIVDSVGGTGFYFANTTRGNTITGNLAIHVVGNGLKNITNNIANTPHSAGYGFKFEGTLNTLTGNIAAGMVAGITHNFMVGFMWDVFVNDTFQPIRVPPFPGATGNQYIELPKMPALTVIGNEAYGPLASGLLVWDIKGGSKEVPSLIKDFKVWNHLYAGMEILLSENIIVENYAAYGNPKKMSTSTGITLGDISNFHLKNPKIIGFAVGIRGPGYIHDQTFSIDGGTLANWSDILIPLSNKYNDGRELTAPQRINIRTVSHLPVPEVTLGKEAVHTDPLIVNDYYNAMLKREIFVENHDGIQGQNFQVFFDEQSPDYVPPPSGANGQTRFVGSPEAGRTNAELMAIYGTAVAGAVAPCTDRTTHPDIQGFTCPLTATPFPSPSASPRPSPSPSLSPTPTPNTAPTITLTPSQTTYTVKAGELLSLSINATDPDGDVVTITIPNLSTLLPGATLQ